MRETILQKPLNANASHPRNPVNNITKWLCASIITVCCVHQALRRPPVIATPPTIVHSIQSFYSTNPPVGGGRHFHACKWRVGMRQTFYLLIYSLLFDSMEIAPIRDMLIFHLTSVVLQQADPVEATITGTPKQTNVSLLHETPLVDDDGDTDPSITTYGTNEGNITMPEISWGISDERTDDIVGFRKVHYHLFEVTTNWMQQSENKYHPFYLKWQKAIHSGLTALSEWDRVAKLFQLSYVQDYVPLMNQCPHI